MKERSKLLNIVHNSFHNSLNSDVKFGGINNSTTNNISTIPLVSKKETVLLYIQSVDNPSFNQLLKVKADTKIKAIIKEILGIWGKTNEINGNYKLTILKSEHNDQIILNPDYYLWMYDIFGVVST